MSRALTICNPYPEMIMLGEKRVENREWFTPYRGPFLIHAGKSRAWLSAGDEEKYNLIFGAIIGRADLVDCLHIDKIMAGEYDEKYPWLREHQHANGTWCWILENVRRAPTPIPCNGKQGWWNWAAAPAPEQGKEQGT